MLLRRLVELQRAARLLKLLLRCTLQSIKSDHVPNECCEAADATWKGSRLIISGTAIRAAPLAPVSSGLAGQCSNVAIEGIWSRNATRIADLAVFAV